MISFQRAMLAQLTNPRRLYRRAYVQGVYSRLATSSSLSPTFDCPRGLLAMEAPFQPDVKVTATLIDVSSRAKYP